MLGPAGNDHLGGLVVQATVLLHPPADRLFQRQNSGSGGILCEVVVDRINGRLLDMLRGIEIRFTGAKANYVDPVRLHLLCHSVNGQGGGCLHGLRDVRKFFHSSSLQIIIRHDKLVSAILYPATCKNASTRPYNFCLFA